MKVLSIKQPWCSLIATGLKDVENRTWKTQYRGKILLHASSSVDNETRELNWCSPFTLTQYNTLDEYLPKDILVSDFKKSLPTSAIIGEVEIVDCVQEYDSIWAEKWSEEQKRFLLWRDGKIKPIWNWILENPLLYDKPIKNIKGKLNLWDYDI